MKLFRNGNRVLRLATRGSELALAQASMVQEQLEAVIRNDEMAFQVEVVTVRTAGDRDRTSALRKIGGKGLFVRGIEEVLLKGEADLAVHSAKDLPYELQEGLVIGGVPKAASPGDMLLIRPDSPFADELSGKSKKRGGRIFRPDASDDGHLPVIGTGSPRRQEELRQLVGPFRAKENRGNIPTRIRKLMDGQFDAIVLAEAGVERLRPDLSGLIVRHFTAGEMIPACGQGILAVECGEDDADVRHLLAEISDRETRERFDIERCLFRSMKADCSTSLGVYAELPGGGDFILTGMYGGRRESRTGEVKNYPDVCRELAGRLLKR